MELWRSRRWLEILSASRIVKSVLVPSKVLFRTSRIWCVRRRRRVELKEKGACVDGNMAPALASFLSPRHSEIDRPPYFMTGWTELTRVFCAGIWSHLCFLLILPCRGPGDVKVVQ